LTDYQKMIKLNDASEKSICSRKRNQVQRTFCNRESEIKKLMTRAKYSIRVLKEKAVRC